jgi:hypothetical protein
MGQLLLAGWTMLADCCDECACPLMRQPAGAAPPGAAREELCVSCGRAFREGQPLDGGGAAGGAANGPAPAAAPAPDGPGTPTAAGAAAAGGAGSGSPARASPARSSPARARRAAAAAAAAAPAAAAAAPQPTSRRAVGEPSASDRAADLLSERMLQGWALLERCCPL